MSVRPTSFFRHRLDSVHNQQSKTGSPRLAAVSFVCPTWFLPDFRAPFSAARTPATGVWAGLSSGQIRPRSPPDCISVRHDGTARRQKIQVRGTRLVCPIWHLFWLRICSRPWLHGPWLHGPWLHGPWLHGPWLHGPWLHGPWLHGPWLHGPWLHGPWLHGPWLHGPWLHGPWLHGPWLHGPWLHGPWLHGPWLHGPWLHGPWLHGPWLHGPWLHGPWLHGPWLHGPWLHGPWLHGPWLHGPWLHGPWLHGPWLHGPWLHGPWLHGPWLHGPWLHGTNESELPGGTRFFEPSLVGSLDHIVHLGARDRHPLGRPNRNGGSGRTLLRCFSHERQIPSPSLQSIQKTGALPFCTRTERRRPYRRPDPAWARPELPQRTPYPSVALPVIRHRRRRSWLCRRRPGS